MRSIGTLLSLLLLLTLGGCGVDSVSTIHLNRDGSGTLTVRQIDYDTDGGLVRKNPASEQIALTYEEPTEGELEDFRSDSEKYGEGMTPLQLRAFRTSDGGEGMEEVYRFENINNLVLNDEVLLWQRLRFQYADGRLEILNPQPEGKTERLKSEFQKLQQASPQEKEQADFRVSLTLTVQGGVKSTDALYPLPDGKGITLQRLDLVRMMSTPDALWKYAQVDPADRESMERLTQEYPYFLDESQEKVTVEF